MINQESQDAYLRKLAKRNVFDGILREPRIYYDQFVFPVASENPDQVRQYSNPEAFRNGEQYPIQITHMTAMMRRQIEDDARQTPTQGDERLIQQFAMRIGVNDNFYMNKNVVPLPHWHNVTCAASDVITRGTSVWKFLSAFPLGQRDALIVNISMIGPLFVSPPEEARPVVVSFDGIGRASRRPYHLSASTTLDTVVSGGFQLNTDDLRNDGAEVIDITQMSLFAGSPIDANNPAGDVQQIALNIRQTGNGTNQTWGSTPITGTGLVPAGLWSPSISRAVVHRFPGDGLIWQPGQGLNVEMVNQTASRTLSEGVDLAFLGYIIVT